MNAWARTVYVPHNHSIEDGTIKQPYKGYIMELIRKGYNIQSEIL